MRRRWKVILASIAMIVVGGGLVGWWYADRTIIARMAQRDGTDALLAGHPTLAEERFSAAVQKFPADSRESARAYLWRAQARFVLDRFDEAHADADKSLQINPTDTSARTVRAESAYKLGRHGDAQADLDRVLEAKPDVPSANYWRGLLAERKGDWDAAERHYLRAAQSEILFARAYTGLSRVAKARGNATAAESHMAVARGRDPNVSVEIE